MKCAICGKEIEGYGNNGQPLVEGKVGDCCNWKVIRERLRLANEAEVKKNSANESISGGEVDGVVVGSGGPVNTCDPVNDFEEYAKKFEETFILGNTPVRKEKPENKTKVDDGAIEGEVISIDKKEESLDQVEPIKSATESLHGFSEIYEFLKLCKELGIDDYGWVQRFVEEHPGDPLTELRKYRESLGKDWKNKDLSIEDIEEVHELRSKEMLAKK